MSGERFPAWKYVAALARACGADPEVLRRVWEASNARRDNQPAPASLASALRFLHLRAGSPTPWAIAVTSGGTLNQDHVTALLDGTSTGEWDHVRRLIQLLDGEPSYFLPLWETETPTAPEAPQPPPTREDPPTASTRVEELLTAFKGALGPPGLTPTRRCLATLHTRRNPLERPLTGGDVPAGSTVGAVLRRRRLSCPSCQPILPRYPDTADIVAR